MLVVVKERDTAPEFVTLTVGDGDDVTEIVDECDGDTDKEPEVDKLGDTLVVIVVDSVGDTVPEMVRLPLAVTDTVTVVLTV